MKIGPVMCLKTTVPKNVEIEVISKINKINPQIVFVFTIAIVFSRKKNEIPIVKNKKDKKNTAILPSSSPL
jgi:hypothetical protein